MCPAQTLGLPSGLGGGAGSPVSQPNPFPATITWFRFQPRLARRHVSPHILRVAADRVAGGAGSKTTGRLGL